MIKSTRLQTGQGVDNTSYGSTHYILYYYSLNSNGLVLDIICGPNVIKYNGDKIIFQFSILLVINMTRDWCQVPFHSRRHTKNNLSQLGFWNFCSVIFLSG